MIHQVLYNYYTSLDAEITSSTKLVAAPALGLLHFRLNALLLIVAISLRR